MPIFLGINLYDFVSRAISVKILINEFISLERKSVEQPTSVVGVGGGKKETECEQSTEDEKRDIQMCIVEKDCMR
jgi:hypothetical protein